MKKTINVNLGGKILYVEEDAFSRLDSYLSEIRTHFSKYTDAEEIIADIETRIAEQLSETSVSPEEVIVSKESVEKVITSMGHPADFGQETQPNPKESTSDLRPKKLFRNPDDKIIAGVASGLALYFGLDAIWFRLAFILTVITGGWGLLVYFLLFLLVPEARTATEKMQMSGTRATLKDIEQSVKEKILNNEEIKKSAREVSGAFGDVFTYTAKLLVRLVKIFLRILGGILSVAVVVALTGLCIGILTLLLYGGANNIDLPLREVLGNPQFYVGVISVFFVAFVPLVMLLLIGSSLAGWKNNFTKGASTGLVVIWVLATSLAVTLGLTNTQKIDQYYQTSPLYKQETKQLDLKDFNKIVVKNDVQINLHTDPQYKVEVKAVELDQKRLKAEVVDGTLTISKELNSGNFWCLFCPHRRPEVNISLPELTDLTSENAVGISGKITSTKPLNVTLVNASGLEAELNSPEINLTLANGSNATLFGVSPRLSANLTNGSRLNSRALVAQQVKVVAQNGSYATVRAEETLTAERSNGSRIRYFGEPVVTGSADKIEFDN